MRDLVSKNTCEFLMAGLPHKEDINYYFDAN
jgi:hypothetical protein